MELVLAKLSSKTRGIYGPRKNILPERMLYLHPDAADLFGKFAHTMVFSDIYRSAESSLEARSRKRGVQRPGYSGHNFGLSFDVAVNETLRANKGWNYAYLLDLLADYTWHCYRRDRKRGKEDWHFNYLGGNAKHILRRIEKSNRRTWSRGAELAIQDRYGGSFDLHPAGAQAALRKLGMYGGALDGVAGPLTRMAAALFGRAWGVPSSIGNTVFQRTLALVAADKRVVGV